MASLDDKSAEELTQIRQAKEQQKVSILELSVHTCPFFFPKIDTILQCKAIKAEFVWVGHPNCSNLTFLVDYNGLLADKGLFASSLLFLST